MFRTTGPNSQVRMGRARKLSVTGLTPGTPEIVRRPSCVDEEAIGPAMCRSLMASSEWAGKYILPGCGATRTIRGVAHASTSALFRM